MVWKVGWRSRIAFSMQVQHPELHESASLRHFNLPPQSAPDPLPHQLSAMNLLLQRGGDAISSPGCLCAPRIPSARSSHRSSPLFSCQLTCYTIFSARADPGPCPPAPRREALPSSCCHVSKPCCCPTWRVAQGSRALTSLVPQCRA
jgi:hypothetical protein